VLLQTVCCSVLQCVAVCYSVLSVVQSTSLHPADSFDCILQHTLQHAATHAAAHATQRQFNVGIYCNTLQHTAADMYCNTLQHTATHDNTRQHTASHDKTLHHTEHTVTHSNTVQHTLQHTRQHTPQRRFDADVEWSKRYGVASISRLLKTIGLFCKRAL